MQNKILRAFLSVVLVTIAFLSTTSRLSSVNAANYREQVPLSQAVSGIEGNWLGALEVSGFKLRLALKISKTADGKFTAKMDSLDQNAKDFGSGYDHLSGRHTEI
jgi:hypothetical protein